MEYVVFILIRLFFNEKEIVGVNGKGRKFKISFRRSYLKLRRFLIIFIIEKFILVY